MGGATTRIPMSHRVLSPSYNYNAGDNSGDHPAVQLSGSIFGFLEQELAVFSSPESDGFPDIEEDETEPENPEKIEDNIKFWESQHQNLHVSFRLFNYNSFSGSRLHKILT